MSRSNFPREDAFSAYERISHQVTNRIYRSLLPRLNEPGALIAALDEAFFEGWRARPEILRRKANEYANKVFAGKEFHLSADEEQFEQQARAIMSALVQAWADGYIAASQERNGS